MLYTNDTCMSIMTIVCRRNDPTELAQAFGKAPACAKFGMRIYIATRMHMHTHTHMHMLEGVLVRRLPLAASAFAPLGKKNMHMHIDIT